MVVDEDKHGVSEDRRKMRGLLGPVPYGSLSIEPIFSKVVEGPDVEAQQGNNPHDGGDHLQGLTVFDISKREPDGKGSEDGDRNIVDPGVLLFKCGLVIINNIGDLLVQTFCTGDVLEAHRSIHVENQDENKEVLDPGVSDPLADHSNLYLLADIVGALFHMSIFVATSPCYLGRFETLLGENGVPSSARVHAISNRDGLHKVGSGDPR